MLVLNPWPAAGAAQSRRRSARRPSVGAERQSRSDWDASERVADRLPDESIASVLNRLGMRSVQGLPGQGAARRPNLSAALNQRNNSVLMDVCAATLYLV
jgi:hypothetical protein